MEKDNQPRYIVEKPKPSLAFVGYGLIVAIFSIIGGIVGGYLKEPQAQARCMENVPPDYEITQIENPVVAVVGETINSVVGVGIGDKSAENKLTSKQLAGTGMIYRADGYIITNYHVVAQAIKNENTGVYVVIQDKQYMAKVVGHDFVSDIALLKIEENNLTPVTFGDSSAVKVGEMAVAIGNPIEETLSRTVTVGYVSATNRKVNIDGISYEFIQSDAAINQGNSGGPLVNIKGQVIGMNTVKAMGYAVEGISFSIPSNIVTDIAQKLLNDGKIERLIIGIYGSTITEEIAEENDIKMGIVVVEIIENTPASLAGIKVDDYITHVDGKQVMTMDELNEIKATHKVGDTMVLTVLRPKESNPKEYDTLSIKLVLVEDTGER